MLSNVQYSDVTLKAFISNYNDMRRDKFRDKLDTAKNIESERNRRALEIEKLYHDADYGYKKKQLQSREKFISKQIDYYSKGIKIINNNLKSSKNLQSYIQSNLDTSHNEDNYSRERSSRHRKKRNLRERHRNRNEKLKREIAEYQKFDAMLDKAANDMIDEENKQHKNMLRATKKLGEQIGAISKSLESQSTKMEVQFSQITRKRKSVLEIPWHSVGSEGDINLHFNELMNPLYSMYKALRKEEQEWFIDRKSLREQCMIHRMFWKKYSQWQSLQRKLNEFKKTEYESSKYTQDLEKDMNDIIENNKYDKYQLQINKKQAIIKAKADALREKEDTLKILKDILGQYKFSVSSMTSKVEKIEKENNQNQRKIARAAKKRYQALIHSHKIDPEMKQYLETRKKTVKSQEHTLEELWREMNEKRQLLKGLQWETRQMKMESDDDTTTDSGSFDLDDYDYLDDGDDGFDNDEFGFDSDEFNPERFHPSTKGLRGRDTPTGLSRTPRDRVTKTDNTDKPEKLSLDEEILKLENDIKQEKDQIKELNKKITKQEREIHKKDKEIDSKQKRKETHDQSLALVQAQHDQKYESYKVYKDKIDKLNEEKASKFRAMFDDILDQSEKVTKLGKENKSKQPPEPTPTPDIKEKSASASIPSALSPSPLAPVHEKQQHEEKKINEIHEDMEVDDSKIQMLGEKDEIEKSKSTSLQPIQFPGVSPHEPGTTPPNMNQDMKKDENEDEVDEDDGGPPIQLMTRKGSIAIDHMDNLCMKNNITVSKIENDLKQVYDIDDDLDYEATMLELRSVMDSIKHDREALDEKFITEEQELHQQERDIEDDYKRQKSMLKRERDKQKKELKRERKRAQQERKELQQQSLLERVSSSPDLHPIIHHKDLKDLKELNKSKPSEDRLVSISSHSEHKEQRKKIESVEEHGNNHVHMEEPKGDNDTDSLSELSDISTDSSADSENDKRKGRVQKKKKKPHKKYKPNQRRRQHSKNIDI